MTPKPWLFVGLGNPEDKFKGTRHNVGFNMIDTFAESEGIAMDTVFCKAIFGKGLLQIPHISEIALLISHIVVNLGVKVEERAIGSDMTLRAWDRHFFKSLLQSALFYIIFGGYANEGMKESAIVVHTKELQTTLFYEPICRP
ncbi:peptidyl-tRNA hydrolase family protein [Artemisia annua]|uniref:Peptidyl-tRNA hydrolase family protein n=1 Tax=Artemisia annua TaxID=35608 RepID=A0A2U1N1R6_ARTAN|nr:peptidyl-tRNA hydrolase family protein [Artemisia annua]